MLSKRIFSAVIGIALFILFILWGSFPFFVFISLITVLGIREYVNLLPEKFKNARYYLMILSLIMVSYTYFNNTGYINLPLGLIFIFIFFFLIIYHIFKYNYKDIIISIGTYLFGLIYIGGGMSIFILLRDLKVDYFFNTGALWLALIATWATDTGAYFVGRFLGKNKLAEKISPNKTIEGALGGILLTVLTVITYANIFDLYSYSWIFYGVFVAVVAMMGDLLESSLKRDMNVKDSGRLIPGHGGILDRFDSLLFTIPFTYYFLTLLF